MHTVTFIGIAIITAIDIDIAIVNATAIVTAHTFTSQPNNTEPHANQFIV